MPDIRRCSSTTVSLPLCSCCLSYPFRLLLVSRFRPSSVWLLVPFFPASLLLLDSGIHLPVHSLTLTLFTAPGIPAATHYSPVHVPFKLVSLPEVAAEPYSPPHLHTCTRSGAISVCEMFAEYGLRSENKKGQIFSVISIILRLYLFIYLFIYLFLSAPHGMQDLTSSTRD